MTNKKRVVLIDNNIVDCMLVKGIINDLGLELIIMDNVEKARELMLTDGKTAVVFLNIPQGKRSYEDTISELRANDQDLPIVGIMSYGAKAHVKNVMETGLNDYIVRPLKRDAVLKKMKPFVDLEKAA